MDRVINLEERPLTWAAGRWTTSPAAARPYVFPPGTLLEPGGFLVRYRSTTGVALNQDADTARLLAPDGREVDAFAYRNPGRDASYSRAVDGTGEWTDAYPPSPGGPNLPGAPTPTRYATPPNARRRRLRLRRRRPSLRPDRASSQRGAARTVRDRLERRRRGEHG